MPFIKKILASGLKLLFIFFITILLIELSYRFYIIDFYKPELKQLNESSDLKKTEVDFLVFGDSFLASPKNNFSYFLNEKYKDRTFINSSVIGIGIKQVNTFASLRIKRYKPKAIIYEVYVGNDLIDVDHLSNWGKLSLMRNLYWGMSDYFMSLSYINYRLAPLKVRQSEIPPDYQKNISASFSVQEYNSRTKLLFKADPKYLDKSINFGADFEKRFKIWKKNMKKFLDKIPDDINVYVVFVPHCAQVNEFYFNNMKKLGADFNKNFTFNKLSYTFFEKAKNEFMSRNNITFLNSLPYLKVKDTSNNRLFFLNDPHLNDKGQRVLTEFVEKEVLLKYSN